MITTFLSAFIDGSALLIRHNRRKEILKNITKRYEYHLSHSPIVPTVYAPKTWNVRHIISDLKARKTASCIVFLDCKLELCNSEEELLELYNEAKRVSGATDINHCKDFFVLYIQKWSSSRINLDPRIRWILTKDPMESENLELEYKPFGVRKTILADVRQRNAIRNS